MRGGRRRSLAPQRRWLSAPRYAEAVFTAQQTLEDGQAFYADLKRRVAAYGRDPEQVKILPGIVAVIGGTEAEAE